MTDTVPLNKLILSPRNVRKTNGDEDIESLADSIASKGLLQNLVVSEAQGGKGLYEVDAGGRRYRALMLLAQRKAIARNFPVPVLVVPREDATEASLAENLQKIAMNPADEVEAFAAIVERYAEGGIADRAEQVANCARRFGVTVRHVEQRLRLAALAPEILDALRESRITLDAARAYASHPDPKVQLKLFLAEEKKENWGHSAQAIRNALSGKTYALTHPRVRFVGIEAYVEAGGRLEPDLFFGTDEDESLVVDTHIVDKLATDKASIEAGRLALAEGWADGMFKPEVYTYALPKAPQGFEPRQWGAGAMKPEQRDSAIALFTLDGEGRLQRAEQCFVKAAPADKGSGSPGLSPAAQRDWQAERRREEIRELAARLAAPPVTGTPLEGLAFWPTDYDDYLPSCTDDEEDENFVVVALLIRVPKTDVEARLGEAEQLYAQREAEAEAAEDAEGDNETGEAPAAAAAEPEAVS